MGKSLNETAWIRYLYRKIIKILMVTRSHGPRRGTRKKLKKKIRERGKIKIAKFMQEFKEGEKVVIKPDPSYQKGMPNRRFFGRVGVIVSKRGKAYILEVKDGGKTKQVISLPVHLKKVGE